jgi:hypothetical protein
MPRRIYFRMIFNRAADGAGNEPMASRAADDKLFTPRVRISHLSGDLRWRLDSAPRISAGMNKGWT